MKNKQHSEKINIIKHFAILFEGFIPKTMNNYLRESVLYFMKNQNKITESQFNSLCNALQMLNYYNEVMTPELQ
jgi:hypothetical protein